jgi:hypothetical protein
LFRPPAVGTGQLPVELRTAGVPAMQQSYSPATASMPLAFAPATIRPCFTLFVAFCTVLFRLAQAWGCWQSKAVD